MSDTKIKFNLVDFFVVFAAIVVVAAIVAQYFTSSSEIEPSHTAHIEFAVSSIPRSHEGLFFEDAEFHLYAETAFLGTITEYNIATATIFGWDDINRIDVNFTLQAEGVFRDVHFYLGGEHAIIPGMTVSLLVDNHLIHALVLDVNFVIAEPRNIFE